MQYDELESRLRQNSQRALFNYWRRRATRHGLPVAKDFHLNDLREFCDQIFLIKVKREAARLRFRCDYAGTKVVLHLGQNPKGRWIDEVLSTQEGSVLRLAFVELTALKRPQLLKREAGLSGPQGRIEEDLLLPCIGDNDMVELIICHSTTLNRFAEDTDNQEVRQAVWGLFRS